MAKPAELSEVLWSQFVADWLEVNRCTEAVSRLVFSYDPCQLAELRAALVAACANVDAAFHQFEDGDD